MYAYTLHISYVHVYTAAVDDGLSPDGQIVPGIGKQHV